MRKYRLIIPVVIMILISLLYIDSHGKPQAFSCGEYKGQEVRKEILDIDLFNDLTVDRLRTQGINVEVYKYTEQDGKYDIEFISKQERLRYTTNTFLYIRKRAAWFGVNVWAGVSVYDGHMSITQNENIYVISLPDLKLKETVKIIGLPVNSVIVNSVKVENGWLVLYSVKDRQGLAQINEKGIYTGETVQLPYSYVCSYKYDKNGVQSFPVGQTYLAVSKENSDIVLYSGIGFRDAPLGGSYAINTKTGWMAKIDYDKLATYQDYYEYDKYINHYILSFNTVEQRGEEYNPHIMAAVSVDEGTEQILSYFTFSDDIIPDNFLEDGYICDRHSLTSDYIKISNPVLYHTISIDFHKETIESVSAPIVTEKKTDFWGQHGCNEYSEYEIVARNTKYFDTDYTEYILKYYPEENKTPQEKLLFTDYASDSHIKDAYFNNRGEAVVFSDYEYLVYDNDMNNLYPVYRLSDCIAIGKNIDDGIQHRTLTGVCDYNGKLLIAGFYDIPDIAKDELYLDKSKDSWQLKPTYKIAVTDAYGKIKIYDTGVNILKFADKISGTVISMDNSYTVRIKSDLKHANNKIYFEGTLNLNTGIYTPEIAFLLD